MEGHFLHDRLTPRSFCWSDHSSERAMKIITVQSFADYLEQAMGRFDKKRPGRKTRNAEWVNPHDPEAKVGRTKQGATDMVYKPEHISDLDSGAIVQVEVRSGDAADNDASLNQRVLTAVGVLLEVAPEAAAGKVGTTVVADEGYFALEQIDQMHSLGIRTVIADPHAHRRRKDLPASARTTLRRARAATRSESGKALLRKRDEHLERGFAHVLDHGGLRRATLRGRENLTKRHMVAALSFNLSLLLRGLFGIGTPKQWLAGSLKRLQARLEAAFWRWMARGGDFVDLLPQFWPRSASAASEPDFDCARFNLSFFNRLLTPAK
jgi:transposase